MSQRTLSHPYQTPTWLWPLRLDAYDRFPSLKDEERAALAHVFGRSTRGLVTKEIRDILARLLQPIDDVCTYVGMRERERCEIARFLLCEIYRRGRTFWDWSEEEWIEMVGSSQAACAARHGKQESGHPARSFLPVFAYLLDTLPDVGRLVSLVQLSVVGSKIFGRARINEAVGQLAAIFQKWGYEPHADLRNFTACLCYLFMLNRSPSLYDLTIELLENVQQSCTIPCVRNDLFRTARALVVLGIIQRPLPRWPRQRLTPPDQGPGGSMSEEWRSWCDRWFEHTTLQKARGRYYCLLKAGRWLKCTHPEITSPAQWTYELAAEYVAAVNSMKIGELADTDYLARVNPKRLGQPLRPRAKHALIRSMCVFVRDCQEWGWIPPRLTPARAFRTPRSLRNLMGPDPQVIDREFWAKILWAALNLQEEDLPQGRNQLVYPLEMVRAVAAVWCFAALRNDEIVRLRIGCIRWQREDVMVPETGEILPQDAVCFLDIPVNKTTTAYTKAVHPLVGKRINAWEHIRPDEQPQALDRKTSEAVHFLFSYRGMRVSKAYINKYLIPLLCSKAGIPLQDSRGKITSHRARATIASQLYNAREPLDIFQLKEYLGHKYLTSTQCYVRVDPTKLASKVAKVGYLEQNMATIEVLLDQEAVMSGAASRGECWKYYDLGHGYCTNPFWAACAHRMACAKCPYYRPKDSLAEQLIEGKANLVRMLEFVHLTEDEKLLVTEGIELHQELIEKLADVPTPAGPTPRELENSHPPETKVIPLKTIRRNKKKQDEP